MIQVLPIFAADTLVSVFHRNAFINYRPQNISLILPRLHQTPKYLTVRKKLLHGKNSISNFRNVMSCKLCPKSRPVCVMQLAEKCVQEELCSDWTHITAREHVCQWCIDIIKAETGVDNYVEFKGRWNLDCLYPATTLTYITERLLPYCLQCKTCPKWRKLQNSHLKEAQPIEKDLDSTLARVSYKFPKNGHAFQICIFSNYDVINHEILTSL